MEIAANDQSGSAMKASKLRYPLRSATRPKVPPAVSTDPPSLSASKRGKPSSDVSKSVCVLDLSAAKESSTKPPRRHSIPSKPGANPRPTPNGNITPASGIRTRRSDTLGSVDTPISQASTSIGRRKFSTLSSVSYWLTQIRLAEAASKHSVSLGFFKLALESGCEPLDRIREELKTYVKRHGLATELEDSVKDVLQVYEIVEDFEQLKVSGSSSKEKIADNITGNSNTLRNGNLKPRSLNSASLPNDDLNKKENIQKGKTHSKVRCSQNKLPVKAATVKDANAKQAEKKSRKQEKEQQSGENASNNTLPNNATDEPVDVLPVEVSHEDKENMGDVEMLVDAGIAAEL